MRAIVTGSAGFIGSHLVKRLRSMGNHVIEIDRKTGPSIEEQAAFPTGDAIFHLAAPVGPVGVLRHPGGLVLQDIIETSRIVAEWARYNRCRLVNVSTSEVYGSGGEDAETDPCSFQPEPTARKEYALGKLAAETMLSRMGIDVVHVRPFNVAGPGQSSLGGFVIPRFIEQAIAGMPLTVYLPGTQRRAFTHVDDIVDGLVLAYEKGKSGEVYNLGNSLNECSLTDLAYRVLNAVSVGPQGTVVWVDPTTLHGPDFREAPDKIPNFRKAVLELGWHPERDLPTIIRDAVDSYLTVAK